MQLKALSHFAAVAAAAIVGVVLERIRARRNYALIERAPGFKAWRMSKWVKHAGRIATQGLVGTAAASSLAALVAGRLAGTVLWCLDVTCREEPYGPGLAALGLDPSRLVLARCRGGKEMLWVMEEGLRSTAPAAVIAEPEADIGLIESRRLQLAAEVGRTIGMVLREKGGEGCLAPSAVASRWQVDPEPCGGWRLILRRCRGTVGAENEWKAKYHDASGDLALAAEAGDGPGAASERFHLV